MDGQNRPVLSPDQQKIVDILLRAESQRRIIKDVLFLLVNGVPFWAKAFTSDELTDLPRQYGPDIFDKIFSTLGGENYWQFPTPIEEKDLNDAFEMLEVRQVKADV